MKIKPEIKELAESHVSSIWIANANHELNPDLARVAGAKMDSENLKLELFISSIYFEPLAQSLQPGNKLAFLLASVVDFTSYQIKGSYLNHAPCSDDEKAYMRKYMDGFSTQLTTLGFVKEKVYAAYLFEPFIKIVMSIEDIFEQSPRVGTGEKLSNLVE